MSISFWPVACKALVGVGMLGAVVVPPTIAVQQLREQPPSIEEMTEQEEPSAPAPTPEPEEAPEPAEVVVEEEAVVTPSTPTAPAAQPTVQPSVSTQPTAELSQAVTVGEFVERYRGKCPHEIPDWEGMKKDHARAAALGLNTSYYTDPGLHTIECTWTQNRQRPVTWDAWVGGTANGVLTDVPANRGIGFYMDWVTKTVYWDNVWENQRPDSRKATGEYPAEWDTIATRLTNELRRIENGYNALCPND